MLHKFVHRRPFASFTIGAYLFSWISWGVAFGVLDDSIATLFYYLGGFGPLVAAMVVLRMQGRSLRAWIASLFKWRLNSIWYLFALGFPMLLVAIVSLIYLLQGNSLNLAALPERLLAYPSTLLALALIGGGNEEPGWRGVGLPALQQRHSPFTATCILGMVWAFWHFPLLATISDVAAGTLELGQIFVITGVTLLSIATHAFWYTWLINKTGSVLLCIILHASYNTANGLLLLVPDDALHGSSYQSLLILMTVVLGISVAFLLAITKGRLGSLRQ